MSRLASLSSFGMLLLALVSPGAAPADLAPPALLAASLSGGEYLLGQQRPDGSFHDVYDSQQNTWGEGNHLLFQAGACYALFELYGASGDGRFLAAGDRGVAWLESRLREVAPVGEGQGVAALMGEAGTARLDDTALLLLALLKRQELTGAADLPRLRQLARFVLFLQEPSGKFQPVYAAEAASGGPWAFVHDPGEAILALARLARVDPEGPWLAHARQAVNWLIAVRDLGKSVDQLRPDPWLLMALDELHAAAPQTSRRYFLHGRRMATGILRAQHTGAAPAPDWEGSFYHPPRTTPTALRAAALVAMVRLARRGGDDPRPYLAGLQRCAAFQLRCQLSVETARHLPRPDLAAGGFRGGLDDWQVRLDGMQHNLSSLLGLRALLLAP